ncbi:prepilin-type N-terminal cleavage/methylation domain-containing protein [Phycisphaera mikurensis]|nr:prepilin-type N-terminal cleavage/methylation domain-containing protein [Phycisphaera mikurensis]MBB6442560.1 hypothetical protein [Phycisphaera mikurensis]
MASSSPIPRTRPRPRTRRGPRRQAGLSLAEMLISLAISAALLTAVALAMDASFTAYASAAESTSAQSSTRLVVHRIQAMIRGGVAQGPLTPDDHLAWKNTIRLKSGGTLALPEPDFSNNPVTSDYLLLDDRDGRLIALDFDPITATVFLSTPEPDGRYERRPLLQGVTACTFSLFRRRDRQSDYQNVLERGGIDLTVQPGADSTLGTEAGQSPPIRLIASTSPRRLR